MNKLLNPHIKLMDIFDIICEQEHPQKVKIRNEKKSDEKPRTLDDILEELIQNDETGGEKNTVTPINETLTPDVTPDPRCNKNVKDDWRCSIFNRKCTNDRKDEIKKCNEDGFENYKKKKKEEEVRLKNVEIGKQIQVAQVFVEELTVEHIAGFDESDYQTHLSQLYSLIMNTYKGMKHDNSGEWSLNQINHILLGIRDKILMQWLQMFSRFKDGGDDVRNVFYVILLIDVFMSPYEEKREKGGESPMFEEHALTMQSQIDVSNVDVYVSELRGVLYIVNGDTEKAHEQFDVATSKHNKINTDLKEVHSKFQKIHLTLRTEGVPGVTNLEPPEKLQMKNEDDHSENDKRSMKMWEKVEEKYENGISEILDDFYIPDVGIPFTIQTK